MLHFVLQFVLHFVLHFVAGEVPFGAPSNGQPKSELEIYAQITAHTKGQLNCPADFSDDVTALLNGE